MVVNAVLLVVNFVLDQTRNVYLTMTRLQEGMIDIVGLITKMAEKVNAVDEKRVESFNLLAENIMSATKALENPKKKRLPKKTDGENPKEGNSP